MTGRLPRLLSLWCAGVIPLLTFGPGLDAFELPKMLALHLAGTALWLSAVRSGVAVRTALLPPIAVLLLLGLLSTMTSRLPLTGLFGEYTSYQGWVHWMMLAALLVALPGGASGRIRTAATLGLTAGAGIALFQLVLPDPSGDPLRRAYGTAGNAYFLGTVLALGVPLAIGLAGDTPRPARRRWWLGCTAVILAGVAASGSRSALAAALAGGALVAGWRRRGIMKPAALAAGLALTACGLLLPADRNPFPPLARRVADLVRGRDARGEIWAMAGRLIRQAPLIGHGPESFATQGGAVQTPALWAKLWRGNPEKAHNELLQLTVSTGVLGCGAALWLLLVIRRGAGALPGGTGVAAALAGLGFTSLFGFITLSPQAVAIPLIALLLVQLPVQRVSPVATRLVAGGLVLSVLAHARFLAADARLRAVIASGSTRIGPAVRPPLPFANRLLRAGDLLERRWLGGTVGGTPPARVGLEQLNALTALYAGARSLNPLHPLAHSSLARLAAREGRVQDADAGYRLARSLAPLDVYLVLEHGQVLLAADREAEGLAELARAAGLYPGFAEPVGMAGYVHLKAGRTKDAERLLAQSLTLDWHGNAAAAYAAAMNLATLYHRSGREADARRTAALADSWRQRIRSPVGMP